MATNRLGELFADECPDLWRTNASEQQVSI
jgi:hypothetical protein